MKKRLPKRKKRNRRKGEPLGRKLRRFFTRAAVTVTVASALVFSVLSVRWLYRKVLTTPLLEVGTIVVEGNGRTPSERIISLSGIRKGTNIFSFSAAEAARSVERAPWIEEARVRRTLPDKVTIRVRERKPVALVRLSDLYVMDEKGVIFKRFEPSDGLDLPVVTGLTERIIKNGDRRIEDGLLTLLELLEEGRGLEAERVSEVHVDPDYGFTIYTVDKGVRVDLGFSELDKRLARLERIRAMRKDSLAGVRSIDLMVEKGAIVRFDHAVLKGGGRI